MVSWLAFPLALMGAHMKAILKQSKKQPEALRVTSKRIQKQIFDPKRSRNVGLKLLFSTLKTAFSRNLADAPDEATS
jgi:hypothetical protein